MKTLSSGSRVDLERSHFCPLTQRWVQGEGVVLAVQGGWNPFELALSSGIEVRQSLLWQQKAASRVCAALCAGDPGAVIGCLFVPCVIKAASARGVA